jgi:ATP synthase protein I
MADKDQRERLAELQKRIDSARKRREPPPRTENRMLDASNAWRMVIELVTGLVVGFGIGYGLDWVFGTLPVFLVVFTLLGFAAGVRVMTETARSMQQGSGAKAPEEKDGD